MSCLGDCIDLGGPPDLILSIPPPPVPAFLQLTFPPLNDSDCFSDVCHTFPKWSTLEKVADKREFVEMSRKEIGTTWSPSGIDETWILILISSIGVLVLGAMLAMFLLKCREMTLFSSGDVCSSVDQIKHIDARNCSVLTNGHKLNASLESLMYHGGMNTNDNRVLWTALTPKGTQHFISEKYPRNLVEMEEENHYESIDYMSIPEVNGYIPYKKDTADMHFSEPLEQSVTWKNNLTLGRAVVSSPSRIEHPNLPPLNLYPYQSQNNTLRQYKTFNRKHIDSTVPKYAM